MRKPHPRIRTSPRIRVHRRGLALAATAVLTITIPTASTATSLITPSSAPPSGGKAAPLPQVPERSPLSARSSSPPVPPGRLPSGPCALSAGKNVQLSEGLPTSGGYSRSTGTVHALTLMIDFPDAHGSGSARQRFEEFFPQTSRWFARSSYGRLDYRSAAPIPRWLRMPHPFRAYRIKRGSSFEPGYRKLVRDIVAAAGNRVDFSQYDLVNVLVTPNAGPPATETVLSVTYADNPEAPAGDGVPLANVSFVYSHQDDGSGSFRTTGYRVLPHENGHVFGLPDLYTDEGADNAGHWDLMSEDWGAGNDLLAWHKWKLGWLAADQVDCVTSEHGQHGPERPPRGTSAAPGPAATGSRTVRTQHTLSTLGRAGGTKLAFVPVNGHSGYAIEARTNDGVDDMVCKPGVLVYWVDTHVDSGHGPITVRDSTPHSSGCTRQPNVHTDLSDAPFEPGEEFTDGKRGVRVAVTGERGGDYQITVERRASGDGPG